MIRCQRAGLLQDGKRFKVVAADARPHLEGRVLRQRLIKCGIACTYILLNAVACVIPVRSACHPLHSVHTGIQAHQARMGNPLHRLWP